MVLALDAGGSSTRCLLLRPDGTVLAGGRGGPGNHILSGWETARHSIAEAVGHACETAGIRTAAVACAVAGSAGVGPEGEGAEVIEELLAELLPAARVRATGDMVAAFWGALADDRGVVVVAGTGSVCYGRNPAAHDQSGCQVGGWGQLMGDEGSAYDIAVRALRSAARATDGRGPQTLLADRLAAALGVSDLLGVAFRVYGEPMTRDAIARLATTVAETAADGDTVARSLLADAGGELGLAAVTALRKLGLADAAAPVAYGGAVFDAGEVIVTPFGRTVRSACPRATIAHSAFPPVVGAFKLALGELGVAFTPAVAERLRAALEAGT